MLIEPFLIGRRRAALKPVHGAVLFWALVGSAASQPVALEPLALDPLVSLPASMQPATPPTAPSSTRMTRAEWSLLDAINDYRRAQGLAAWAAEPALAAVARGHSQAMAQRGRFSHEGFRQRAQGTGSALCVENLLHGPVSPARAVQSWAASGAHRDNLLETGAGFAGIGMAGRFVTMLACASPPALPVSAGGASQQGSGR